MAAREGEELARQQTLRHLVVAVGVEGVVASAAVVAAVGGSGSFEGPLFWQAESR